VRKKRTGEGEHERAARLSRDVHFVSGPMAERVPFIVAELGADTVIPPAPSSQIWTVSVLQATI
jgi:hypothetical protein